MEKGLRVRIADIAEKLGPSTATVSNVIHGKLYILDLYTRLLTWVLKISGNI